MFLRPATINTFKLGKRTKPTEIKMSANEVFYFKKLEEIEPNTENMHRLYFPDKSFNLKAWDFIYDDGDQTIFFQISASNPDNHKKTIEESFLSENLKPSYNSDLMN